MSKQEHMDGRYFTEGKTVRKAPLRTKTEGGFSISVGFPVCEMTDYVGPEGAEFVATALNLYEGGHAGCMCPHCNPQPSP